MYFRQLNKATALITFAVLATVCIPNVHSLSFLTTSNSSGIQFITHAEFKDIATMFPNLYAIVSSLPVRLDVDSNEQRSNQQEVTTLPPTHHSIEPTTIQIVPIPIPIKTTTVPTVKAEPITTSTIPIVTTTVHITTTTTVVVETTTQVPIKSTTVVVETTTQVTIESTTIQVPLESTTVVVETTTQKPVQSSTVVTESRLGAAKSISSKKLTNTRLIKPTNKNHTVPTHQVPKKPSLVWFINSTQSDSLNLTANLTGHKLDLVNTLLNKTDFLNQTQNDTSLGYNPIIRIENVPKSSDFWFLFNPANATFDKLQAEAKEKYDMFAYNPAWIIGLSVIGTVIGVFFLGCVVAICYTRRPYRRPGKVYEVESANRKNLPQPQIPTINPATRTATLLKNKESFY